MVPCESSRRELFDGTSGIARFDSPLVPRAISSLPATPLDHTFAALRAAPFVATTILSCSTSVGLYDTLTSIARCHWWRWHAFHHHCNWSQRADFVARADWRRRQIVVAGTLGMECRSARLVACCSSSSSAFILWPSWPLFSILVQWSSLLAMLLLFLHHAALRFIRAWAALSLGTQMEMLDTVVMLYDGRGQSHPKVLEHHSMSLFYVWCVCMCVCVCCAEQ